MTRKDYERIAGIINEAFKGVDCYKEPLQKGMTVGINEIMLSFMESLEDTNPRFDKERFYEACVKGVE